MYSNDNNGELLIIFYFVFDYFILFFTIHFFFFLHSSDILSGRYFEYNLFQCLRTYHTMYDNNRYLFVLDVIVFKRDRLSFRLIFGSKCVVRPEKFYHLANTVHHRCFGASVQNAIIYAFSRVNIQRFRN